MYTLWAQLLTFAAPFRGQRTQWRTWLRDRLSAYLDSSMQLWWANIVRTGSVCERAQREHDDHQSETVSNERDDLVPHYTPPKWVVRMGGPIRPFL